MTPGPGTRATGLTNGERGGFPASPRGQARLSGYVRPFPGRPWPRLAAGCSRHTPDLTVYAAASTTDVLTRTRLGLRGGVGSGGAAQLWQLRRPGPADRGRGARGCLPFRGGGMGGVSWRSGASLLRPPEGRLCAIAWSWWLRKRRRGEAPAPGHVADRLLAAERVALGDPGHVPRPLRPRGAGVAEGCTIGSTARGGCSSPRT